jgi:hypothetical protein
VKDVIKEMMSLFCGLDRAYGIYELEKNKVTVEGKKLLGKPKTVQGNVTEQLWRDHLSGHIGLGIVPIMDNSKCFFGAIDIDIYTGFDHKVFVQNIYKQGHPIIPFRSKSGGIHLFMFVKEQVPAKLIIEKLKMIAGYIGHGKAEIFPKQVEILAERGDIGQWINVPYYNYLDSDRFAYDENFDKLPIEKFFILANKYKLSAKDLESYKLLTIDTIEDGPPCLQALIMKGFNPGSRNDCMFNVGVYLKKARPEEYASLIEEYNIKYCDPRLSSAEIQNIINSLRKRDYFYTCDRSPFKDHCNKSLCKTKKHGIGSSLEMPNLTGLTKFNSNPPIWFVDVEDAGRLELNTDELQSQNKFQRKCMEAINQMPPPVKPAIWQTILQNLLENVNIIEVPEDASPTGLFYEYLERFCTSRAQARVKDELLIGKPYTSDGRHYFRLLDLIAFLERNRFKDFRVNKIISMIQEIDGKHHFFKLKEKGVNVWSIPIFPTPVGSFDTPEIEEKTVI